MAIRYCPKCCKVVDDHIEGTNEKKINCLICKTQLLFFGKASVKLSPQAILDQYDNQSLSNPIAQFTGRYENEVSYAIPINVLECEELLKYNPSNISALQYLVRYHMTQKTFVTARSYIQQWLESDPNALEAWQLKVAIEVYNQDWNEALKALNQLQQLDSDNPIIDLNRGRIALQQNQIKEGVQYFYKAYINARSEIEKKQFEKIIQHLTTILDDVTDGVDDER